MLRITANISGWFDVYLSSNASEKLKRLPYSHTTHTHSEDNISVQVLREVAGGDRGRTRYVSLIVDGTQADNVQNYITEVSTIVSAHLDTLVDADNQENAENIVDKVRAELRNFEKKSSVPGKPKKADENGPELKPNLIEEGHDSDQASKERRSTSGNFLTRHLQMIATTALAGNVALALSMAAHTFEFRSDKHQEGLQPEQPLSIEEQIDALSDEFVKSNEMDSLRKEFGSLQQAFADHLAGHHADTPVIVAAKASCNLQQIQSLINSQYGSSLSEDGRWGPKTKKGVINALIRNGSDLETIESLSQEALIKLTNLWIADASLVCP